MRNIDEIRGSIKDLILKAENEELLNIQNKESHNLGNELEILFTLLSDSEFEFGIPPAKTIAGDKKRADSINKRLNISTRSSKNNFYL